MKTKHTMLASAVALLLSTAAMAAPQSSSGAMGGSSASGATGSSSSSSSMRGSSAGSSEQLGSADRKFITEAASAGMFEVQAAQLAQSKAQDPQNKTYAQHMLSDHEKNNQQLMQIAQSKGVSPPTTLDPKHQALLTKLQKADGADFDKQYGKIMDQSHAETIRLFERGEKQVKDTELKSYISQTLPTLQQHHQQSASLPGSKGGSSRSAEAGSSGSMGGTSGSSGSMGGSSGSSGSTSGSSTSGRMGGSSSSGSMSGSSGGSSTMGSSTSGDTSSSDTTSGSASRPGASSGNPDTSNPPKP